MKNNTVADLCSRVLQIESISGNEKKLVNELKKIFEEYNFDDYYVDKYGSITGRIKGKKPGKKILLDSHIDVVEADNRKKWIYDPFSGEIVDDKVYGRGASDMKGALSAMIYAASKFAEDTNRDFEGEIYVTGVVHEECFEGVAARAISDRVKPDYVIIGEASELNLKIGQRGRAEIQIETFGVPAHSANPHAGKNAILNMNRIINKINELELDKHEHLGEGILILTDIISSPYPGKSVIPHYCKATYDRRLVVGETKESVLEPIINIINILKNEIDGFDAKVSYAQGEEKCYTGEVIKDERYFPAWIFDEQEEFVQKCATALEKIGFDFNISYYPFCTNGSHYAGEANYKTIGFGPSKDDIAHTINEYIEISQLEKSVKGYCSIIDELLTNDEIHY